MGEPGKFCFAFWCQWCAAYELRKDVLGGTLNNYSCCQGYMNYCCFKAGSYGESSCPEFCLCLESILCTGPSVSSSRLYLQDTYALDADPCDYRLIHFNNCIQSVSCVIHILADITGDSTLEQLSCILDIITDIVFGCMVGCMYAQVKHELAFRTTMSPGGMKMMSTQVPVQVAQPVPANYSKNVVQL